jgi:hypothetical protein
VAPQCGPCLAQQERDVPMGRMNPQHPGFVESDARYDCAQCVERQGAMNGFPPLGAGNAEAHQLYQAIGGQQRIGMDMIGLDMAVLPLAFELYDVPREDRRLMFEKLMILDGAHRRDRDRRRQLKEAEAKAQAEAKKRLR